MIKETFTDKLIKRFYGITGPLDEQKRQQVDRMGNIAFVVLFYILIFGNCIARTSGPYLSYLTFDYHSGS